MNKGHKLFGRCRYCNKRETAKVHQHVLTKHKRNEHHHAHYYVEHAEDCGEECCFFAENSAKEAVR